MAGIAMVEVPAIKPEEPIDTTVPPIVSAGPPLEMVAPFAIIVPWLSGVHVWPAAMILRAGEAWAGASLTFVCSLGEASPPEFVCAGGLFAAGTAAD